MQYRMSLLLACSVIGAFAAPSAPIQDTPSIIPAPLKKEITTEVPGFSLQEGISLSHGGQNQTANTFLTALKNSGITVRKASGKDKKATLSFDTSSTLDPEAYAIKVTPEAVSVTAGGTPGAFYAAQTLLQSIVKDEKKNDALPVMTIEDKPRFKWRGLMIDSCRYAHSVPELKKIIDLMSRYKMNTLHWHLTDDQGWRIEIKKYPKLTSVGGTRASSPIMGQRNKSDNTPYSFHYTQKDIKDIVQYAKERQITVVPEIEVPGHATAAITAYPQLGNKDVPNYKPEVVTRWGVFPDIFSPAEETFSFLKDVIDEICVLFPDSPYIHIGGDEAPKDQWNKSPFAQEVIKKNNLKDSHELQSYFVRRMEEIVNKKGKKIIGWDEIQEGGLSKTATMMVWRDWKWAKHALDNGNDIIMAPNSHCYLDYRPGPSPAGPEFDMIGGSVPLEKVYSLNPIPEGISPEQEKHILGVQGNCWREYMPTMGKWEYMIFPRALAMAEVGWTTPENKNYEDFKARWDKQKPALDKMKVNYRNDDGSPAQPDAKLTR